MRAGVEALSLLSVPLNVHVLEALEEGPVPLIDLRRTVGMPPQTTMRGRLSALTRTQIVERRRQTEFPNAVDYELCRVGRRLLDVARRLESWLASAPAGPIALGSAAAKSSLKALLGGWSSGIVRAIAAKPFSLTELNKLIGSLNYPSLERRLGALRLAGLVQASDAAGVGTPYAPSEWLRRSVGPLMAAALWERELAPADTSPAGRVDFEASFLLSAPLLELPADRTGTCRLAVELRRAGSEASLAGALVNVVAGRVVSCRSRLDGHADAWAGGGAGAWLRATVAGEVDLLEIGGDAGLATSLLEALRAVQFRSGSGDGRGIPATRFP